MKTTAPKAMPASPTHVRTAQTAFGRVSSHFVDTATRAPMASSQARVKGEKYATVGLEAVWNTDSAKEPAVIITRPANSLA